MSEYVPAFKPEQYDSKVVQTVPFYEMFNKITLELIRSYMSSPDKWLDTGCGTGNLVAQASQVFPDTVFILADPDKDMLDKAKNKMHSNKMHFENKGTHGLAFESDTFDIITAMLCHHYLSVEAREKAIENCFRMLKEGGMFVTFENIKPLSNEGTKIGQKMWADYQLKNGKIESDVREHFARFGKRYFPLTILEHVELLNKIGFKSVEVFWMSYMQAGFYAIK